LTPKKISLGFSPCPNDTFIFEALVNQRIDTGGIIFDVALEDVETLNRRAMEGRMDITKLSYGVLPLVLDNYALLNSGSALGSGVGPLLIRNKEFEIINKKVEDHEVAIPGEHTTAHLLFTLAYPGAKKKIFMRYDMIEDFVSSGKGLGVIIHENRFTYEQKGLKKITDLGDFWEKETGHPIPLGGIVAKRSLDEATSKKVDRLIRQSIEFAFSNYPQLNDYIRLHAQEMSEEVMRKHIELYVNHFSLDLGENGRAAVQYLLNVYQNNRNAAPILLNEILLNSILP